MCGRTGRSSRGCPIAGKGETPGKSDGSAIFSTVKDQEVIAVTANGGASTAIHEFEGTSSLGCLADNSDITLTRSPGGPLGTLLVVVGKGTIHEERY
jgi:hypothetical protein